MSGAVAGDEVWKATPRACRPRLHPQLHVRGGPWGQVVALHQKFLQTKMQLQTTMRQLQMVDQEKKKAPPTLRVVSQ